MLTLWNRIDARGKAAIARNQSAKSIDESGYLGRCLQWAEEVRKPVVLECQLWQEAGRARGDVLGVRADGLTRQRGYPGRRVRGNHSADVLLREWEIVQTAKEASRRAISGGQSLLIKPNWR